MVSWELGVGSEKCGLGVSPSRAPFQDSWGLGVRSHRLVQQRLNYSPDWVWIHKAVVLLSHIVPAKDRNSN